MTLPTVSIFGVPVSKLNMQQTVQYLTDVIAKQSTCQVVTANPIIVMTACEEPNFMTAVQEAELIVPDGTGLVWAAAKIGHPVAERVAGYDLMHELLRVGQQHQWKVFLLGASPETIEAAHNNLYKQYPGVRFVGYHDGYFPPERDAEIVASIREAAPDLLFVGRAQSLQEPWIGRYKEQLGAKVMMGVGGSFDVVAGKLKRAPKIMQRMRVEWLHRLILQPWRFRRMLILPKFAFKVLREQDQLRNLNS